MKMFSNSDVRVTILMATFNGAAYIETQIASIIDQTYTNWELLIRDDGSSDQTLTIVNSFVQKDSRIRLISDDRGNLGSCRNFSALLDHAVGSRYVMFADQDDKWRPFKISNTLEAMRNYESSTDACKPVLVYTDLTFSDESLNPLLSSPNIVPGIPTLKRILAENFIYGCTMMLNRPLIELSKDIPSIAENHDYWIALIATSMGRVYHHPEETLLYRQHGRNISGSYKDRSFINRWKRITSNWEKFKAITYRRVNTAGVFYTKFHDMLPHKNKILIEKYLHLAGEGGIRAIYGLNKWGINKGAFHKNILFYLALLSSGPNGDKEYSPQ